MTSTSISGERGLISTPCLHSERCVIPFADRRDHPQWPDRTLKAGVILDRVRLLELLDELECDELAALIDDRSRGWTRTELLAA